MEPTSVFDSLVASTASPAAYTTSEAKIILRALVDRLANVPGGSGLSALIELLNHHGMTDRATSWVKSSSNADVSGRELAGALLGNNVFPEEWVAATAEAAKVTPEQLFDRLAYIVPAVVERLTPRGELPSDLVVQASLDSIRKQLASAR